MRVLVAEDEARLAEQLAAALAQAGYVVDCADDGERADFLGQTEAYDAVVLDLGLPKIDGLAIVRDLAELYGGTIALESAPSGGLRARLQLPAC